MPPSKSTAGKVLDVLLLFSEEQPLLTAEEISDLLKSPRSTTYRYIAILSDKGFLEKTYADKYRLGPAFLQFGPIIYGESDVARVALPVMHHIMAQTQETVLLTRRFGRQSVCVERVEGSRALRITFERGHTQALHAGASSKILMAYMSEKEWEHYLAYPLETFTENTITEPATLKEHLREIKKAGCCISVGEVDLDAIAIAVPVFDRSKRIVAALSTAGPAFRFDGAAIEQHLSLLRQGASEIEESLF